MVPRVATDEVDHFLPVRVSSGWATLRAFCKLSTLGFSRDIVMAEWPTVEQQQFDQAVLTGVRF